MSHVGPGWSTTWRTHSCVPCRDSSRHLRCSLTRCASHARGPGVEKSLDAARRSACATSATTCPVWLIQFPRHQEVRACPRSLVAGPAGTKTRCRRRAKPARLLVGENLGEGIDALHWICADRRREDTAVDDIQSFRTPYLKIFRNHAVASARAKFIGCL